MPFVRLTPEMEAEALRTTDWAALEAMTDEDIARQVAENPDAAPIMSDADIRRARVRYARRKSGLSQEDFAVRYRLSVDLLRDWESGARQPDSAVLAYLRVIEREPEAVARALAPPRVPA